MEADVPGGLATSKGLLWFDRILRVVTAIFVIGTIAFVVPLGSLVSGRGGVAVDGTVDPPLTIAVDGGTAVVLDADGEARDRRSGIETAEVRAKVRLGDDDTDSRVVLAVSGSALVVAFWVGLIATRRLVRSARQGDPFDTRNVQRLRLLAALFVAVPAGAEVTRRLLASTADVDPRLHVSIAAPDWGVFLVVALGLLALAEVFRAGVALRDLEQATI
jgi:hypothetical protein